MHDILLHSEVTGRGGSAWRGLGHRSEPLPLTFLKREGLGPEPPGEEGAVRLELWVGERGRAWGRHLSKESETARF